MAATLASTNVLAQPSVSGALCGTVVDEQGQAMRGVRIEATGPSVAGVRHAFSDDTGAYRYRTCRPGNTC